MARKRMFSRDIVDSDAYTKMPLSSQLLYFRLVMSADDDGVVDSAFLILRLFGFQNDELDDLCSFGFIIPIDDNVYLIRHWHAHNKIPSAIYTPSRYAHLLKAFKVDVMGAYEIKGSEPTEKDQERESEGCFSKEFLDEANFELQIAEYFIKNNYSSSPDSFIAYNESRGWHGVGGESVKENFVRYADEWEKSSRIKHGIFPITDSIF